jgi:hypothetical protein
MLLAEATVASQGPDGTAAVGTPWLTFDYTVASGQSASFLDYTSTSALTLNGGTIVDAADNAANLTLPATGTDGLVTTNIVIDTTAPSSTITLPSDGGTYNPSTWAGISGTAADDTGGSGLGQVEVSIEQDSTGRYWDGNGFNATTEDYLPATDATSWSYTGITTASLTDGATYTVYSQATDLAGNVQTVPASATFVYNATPVVTLASIANPTNNNEPTFSGTGSILPGVNGTVTVMIYSGATASGTAVQTLTTTCDATTGAYSVTPTTALPDGTYTAEASQTDTAGNTGISATTFLVDTLVPDSAISLPVDGVTYNPTTWAGISGTAADNIGGSGLSQVEVSIEQDSTGTYWDGSGFNATTEDYLSATGTATWSYNTLTAAALTDGVSYTVHAEATDLAGNPQETVASATFSYATPLYWAGGSSNTWDTTALNWLDSSGRPSAWVNGSDAIFAGSSGGTIHISGSVAANSLTFQADGYDIEDSGQGDTLALVSSGTQICVAHAGDLATIGCEIIDPSGGSGSLEKTGDGTLTLSPTPSSTASFPENDVWVFRQPGFAM